MKTAYLKILLLVGLIIPGFFSVNAQKIGSWKTYMAYQNATYVEETETLIYALYESLYDNDANDGSLLSYDPEYDEVITYSFKDGLNDIGIKMMKYAPKHKALVLVYDNCNIDVFYGRNDVINFPDIKNKNIENKTINNIEIVDDYVYISAGFGMVMLDLDQLVIKEDYYSLRMDIRSVCRKGDYLYAATTDGLKKGLLSLNLKDKENWDDVTQEEIPYKGIPANLKKILLFNDQWVIQEKLCAYYQDTDNSVKTLFSGSVRNMQILHGQLILCLYNRVYFYSDFKNFTSIVSMSNSVSSLKADNYWLASRESGVVQIKKAASSSESEIITSGILVNSPIRNLAYQLRFVGGRLLVVGGGRGADNYDNPGTLMVFENGKWFNFDYKQIAEQAGLELKYCRDFMDIAVDPSDPNHYFISSWGQGIYEFKDNEFVNRYSLGNSTLGSASSSGNENYVRVHGIAFDKNGNLYAANERVDRGLAVLNTSGKWESFYYSSISKKYMDDLFIDSKDNKWLNTRVGANITVVDKDGISYYTSNFTDQQGKNVGASIYYCFAEDLNGSIWIGTDNGPIIVSKASDVNDSRCTRIISTDEYGQGYHLLEDISVTAIAVDGGNRKWIGTSGSGLYMVDYTGGELRVENFTTSNSLLISDNITAIAIDDKTGEIFIGTDKGLMSYQGDAVEGSADYSNVYAYPNPIYPERQGTSRVTITGLMSNSTVKITDISGNLINEGTSMGGQYSWNCTNLRGEIVRAGIYLVLASQPDGSTGVATKIMVIK